MAQHGRVWRLLGAEAQQDYEARAHANELLRQDLLQTKLVELEQIIHQTAVEDDQKAQAQQAAFSVSKCHLSPADFEAILEHFTAEHWSHSKGRTIEKGGSHPTRTALRTIAGSTWRSSGSNGAEGPPTSSLDEASGHGPAEIRRDHICLGGG